MKSNSFCEYKLNVLHGVDEFDTLIAGTAVLGCVTLVTPSWSRRISVACYATVRRTKIDWCREALNGTARIFASVHCPLEHGPNPIRSAIQ